MHGYWRDLAYAIRYLRQSPGFTCPAALCLALGIGVNTTVFSLIDYLFYRQLSVRDPDRLVMLTHGANALLSWPDYSDLLDRRQSLEEMAASDPTESSLEFDGETHAAAAEAVSASHPRVIGVRPFMGRWFEHDDTPETVIGYRAWRRWFHGDPHILGKQVRSETQWYTVVGVAPENFAGIYLPLDMDLWIPFSVWVRQYPELRASLADRGRPRVFVFGRMRAGMAPARVAAELNSIGPDRFTVEPVRGVPNPRSRQASLPVAAVLMAVVAAVLLIACVNTGNLLLARGAARGRELATRVALGAGRARLLRQLLTENLVLAALGGSAGFVLGAWTSRLLPAMLTTTAFGETLRLDLRPDTRMVAFSALLSLATTLVFGLAPAWRASRTDVLAVFKGHSAPRRSGLRRISMVAQVSLSLLLLLSAALFLRVLLSFESVDPGFTAVRRIYITMLASAPEFTPETERLFYRQALDRLRALPGVKSAAVTNLLPLTPVNHDCVSAPGADSIPATTSIVSPGYLRTVNIPLYAGRDFGLSDRPQGPEVAVVCGTLARRLWPGEPAVGKSLLLGCRQAVSLQVVGVARDARLRSLGEAPSAHVYLPLAQHSGGIENLIVETASDAGPMLEPVRKAIASTRHGARIFAVRPLAEWVDRSYWQVRWEASLLGAFAVLALLLSVVGLYGVVAYHVTLRTREIGIRMALGAPPAAVLRMVLRQGLGLTLIGIAIGLSLAFVTARAMTRLLYAVSPADPPSYLAVSLLWIGVALAACYLPARRAARVHPTEALRHD